MYAARFLEKTGATGYIETQHSVGNATLFRLLFSLLGCHEPCSSPDHSSRFYGTFHLAISLMPTRLLHYLRNDDEIEVISLAGKKAIQQILTNQRSKDSLMNK
jgi:hypothetical protein